MKGSGEKGEKRKRKQRKLVKEESRDGKREAGKERRRKLPRVSRWSHHAQCVGGRTHSPTATKGHET